LQVKELRIMFVLQSNKSLENDEIRTLKQTSLKKRKIFPACFNSQSVFIAIDGQVQKEQIINPNTQKEK
jgi:predicted oxidoreductase (fatty acid repression mutant protein)